MKPAPSDSPGFETAEAQPSVHTRPSLPLSSGTTVRIDDVPLHSQLDNLSQTRQSDVDWAALVRLVHQPQAYHEAKAVPEDTNTRPLMVGQAAKHAESEARAMASVDLYQDQPADSAYRKPTPRIKHARRPPGAAATLSREDRAFTPLAPTPKAPKGKRKASTTPSARSQKARKGNPRIQRQLGTDPDRPGLIKLKVKLPDDGSLHKFFAPSAILQSSAAPDAASGKDALPRPVASKTRPIDVTPVSTKGNAVQVPDANENRRSSFRARTNKIVTSHLIEGMGYLAKKQPENPLEWLAEFCRIRSDIVEGPRPLLGSSLTTANLLEECEASLSAPAPPPSLATTPERTTAEGEEQPTLNESPEHRHRRSRSLTFDPVAAQADMLRPPRTPKNASSADESDIGYTSATVPAADSSRQVSPVKHRSEDISPSSTVSEGAAPTGTQLQEPPFKPIVDGTMAPEVLVAAKRPPDVFPSSDSTSLIAPSHGHGAAADDEDPTTQPLAASHTAQTTEPDLVTTIPALKPADAYVMLESDAVRPDAASARTASSLQTLSKEAAPAQAPTLDTTKVASPEILITQASPTSQQTRQQHGPNGWDILDKELFRSRVPTPEPRDPYV